MFILIAGNGERVGIINKMKDTIEFARRKRVSLATRRKISRALKGRDADGDGQKDDSKKKKGSFRKKLRRANQVSSGVTAAAMAGLVLKNRLNRNKAGVKVYDPATAQGKMNVTVDGLGLLNPGPSSTQISGLLPPGRGPNKAMPMRGSSTMPGVIEARAPKGGALAVRKTSSMTKPSSYLKTEMGNLKATVDNGIKDIATVGKSAKRTARQTKKAFYLGYREGQGSPTLNKAARGLAKVAKYERRLANKIRKKRK